MAPLEEEMQCGAIKTQSQGGQGRLQLADCKQGAPVLSSTGLQRAGRGGENNAGFLFFFFCFGWLFCFVLFSMYLQVNSLLLLKVYCEQMCPPLPTL